MTMNLYRLAVGSAPPSVEFDVMAMNINRTIILALLTWLLLLLLLLLLYADTPRKVQQGQEWTVAPRYFYYCRHTKKGAARKGIDYASEEIQLSSRLNLFSFT